MKSILGAIELRGELGKWRFSSFNEEVEPGLELIHLKFCADAPMAPPNISLRWKTPMADMQSRWHPLCHFDRRIPPDWVPPVVSSLTFSAPVMQLNNIRGENRLLFALSEAMRQVRLRAGVREETNEMVCELELFSVPEAPFASYEAVLRLDTRRIFYADAVRAAFDWFASFPDYAPVEPPAAALEPVYSSWYSYHQDLAAETLEKECALACGYGMKGIIVDDGWQTDDNRRGYAFCGDWEVSRKRFPDMRTHVEAVHRLGMKYLLWYSVAFMGMKSCNAEAFRGKYLCTVEDQNTYVLDPRFPEVREFLISIYEKALREWDIDGFKFDFIDSFFVTGEDPAVKENYAGRDLKSVPAAVNRLLSDAMARLNRLKPGILIEFRQRYIGPAIRKYGNMLRAGDCPADILSNRVSTIDLRLTSGSTAVHSDMLEWSGDDTAESAALQLLNVLFAVPQISVRLEELPERQRRMLRFWLGFWRTHREVLMHGYLKPLYQTLNYPVVSAENPAEKVIAVYSPGLTVPVECVSGQSCCIVNASGAEELVLELAAAPSACEACDVTGQPVHCGLPAAGFSRMRVPVSGLLKLEWR